MTGVFNVRPSEITPDFVDMLKSFFKDRELVIRVKDEDETDYLLSSEANRKLLLKSVDEIKRHENLTSFNAEEL